MKVNYIKGCYPKWIKGMILSSMLAPILVPPGQAFAAPRFSDVPATHWAAAAIQDFSNAGLINGYQDGTFKPDRYVTREEFLVLAVNMLFGKPKDPPTNDPFDTISWSDWAYDLVEEKGIHSIGEYMHSSTAEITRAEAARIIYTLLNGNAEHLSSKKAIVYLYQKGLTTGSYQNRADYFENYGPTDRLTRAQATVFLTKVRDFKAGKLKDAKSSTKLTDSLVSRITATSQKYGLKVNATSNPERYQSEITGNGLRLDYQFDEFGYGDIGEHWHMTIATLDQSKIPFMASLLVKLGLPMKEAEAQTMLKDVLKLKYGQVGATYKKGKMTIYTSNYFGFHIRWGETRNTKPKAASTGGSYALFVNGEEKVGPGFNTEMDQVFSVNGQIYIPIYSILKGMGGSYDISHDWSTSFIEMGHGVQWLFQWDGVPKKNGSRYVGTLVGDQQEPPVQGVMRSTLYVPIEFISRYYPVKLEKDKETTMIFIGTVPENPTANYFGTKGQYPSTFDFNPLDPQVAYPGGWKAPQLQSTWSADHEKNLEAFERELGFSDGGRSFGVPGASKAITLAGGGPNDATEITMYYTGWGTPPGQPNSTLSESFKIPVVSAQLFKFYFGNDWKTVWNYCNRNDIPEQFTANGRTVNVSYSHNTGILSFEIGRKIK